MQEKTIQELLLQQHLQRALIEQGNLTRMAMVMRKAERGERVNLCFLGGSITQGCLASSEQNCYAYLTYQWWKHNFPNSDIHYWNAGIGATDSRYGAARTKQDVLSKNPDVVFIEFSVNDEDTLEFEESYEGIIRQILSFRLDTAVILIYNMYYDSGKSAEKIHHCLGTYYHLPCISIKNVLYQYIQEKKLVCEDITGDGLHPNDLGHRMVAAIIGECLTEMKQQCEHMDYPEVMELKERLPLPMTDNVWEHTKIYNAQDHIFTLKGFERDLHQKKAYLDIFSNGFKGKNAGDSISFTVSGTTIAIQYKKTIHKPVPVAAVVIDGKQDEAVILDANFTETWGDKLELTTILLHGQPSKHQVVIQITEAHPDDQEAFYMTSVIASD